MKPSSVNFQIETKNGKHDYEGSRWKSHMTTWMCGSNGCLYLGIFPICKSTFTSKILELKRMQY